MKGDQERRHAGIESRPSRALSRKDLTSRPTDGLMDDPPRIPLPGGRADAAEDQLHPEVAGFVRWFTNWWLTCGLELVAEETEERRAA